MAINLLAHILIAVIGNTIFHFTWIGVLIAVAICVFTQAIDSIRIYFYHKKRYGESPAAMSMTWEENARSSQYWLKMPQLYLVKVFFYSTIVLLIAYVARLIL